MPDDQQGVSDVVKQLRTAPSPKPAATGDRPIPKENAWSSVGMWVLLFFVAVGVIGGGRAVFLAVQDTFGWDRSAAPAAPTGPAPLSSMDAGLVNIKCERAVTDLLRTPDGAAFENEMTPIFIEGAWASGGVVKAQNAFGVSVRQNFICDVKGTTEDDAVPSAQLVQ